MMTIMYDNFVEDWLRGCGMVMGRILAFPLTCIVVTLLHYGASLWFSDN